MKLDDAYMDRIEQELFARTMVKKAEGTKVVGVYCAFTPRELIVAAGGIPVALCASSNDAIPVAEQHLPRNFCPLVKSSYGLALSDTCPYFHFSDLLVADSTCEGKRKMYEILSRIKPVHQLGLPQTADGEQALQIWVDELYRLRALLEDQTGNQITDQNLRDAIKQYNRIRELITATYALNKGEVPLLSGCEASIAVDPIGFEVDLPSFIQRMERVIEWAKKRGGLKPRPRILLTGCPTTCKKVLEIIEDSAWVVAMENCGGLKTVNIAEEDEDPMVALARATLKIACPCMTPNRRRFELLAQLAEEYQVDGVVDLTWQACHPFNIESYSLGRFIQDEVGIPFLQIETDYSETDRGWLQVRIEAFVEMLMPLERKRAAGL
ncbi:MAG: double-cubane-cluster-containing anaerobic reductase [Syntrophomonadaceae bacterium]